jgi:ABC-2 type transport system ATP-binding protein
MTDTVIKLSGVSLDYPLHKSLFSLMFKKYNKNKQSYPALREIHLEIKKGEVIGIIGNNGCGKSTLLRVIAGIFSSDKGECLINGNISLLAGLGTGFSNHQTGRENAMLFGSILGYSEEQMIEKLPQIIEFSELDNFIEEPLRTYSAGMKARLGLAVASAIEPEILLIDEVLGVGDPNFKEKSTNRIMEMVGDAGTVVIVSHSFGMLSEVCDRIILMEKGRIHTIGDPKESIKQYYQLGRKAS